MGRPSKASVEFFSSPALGSVRRNGLSGQVRCRVVLVRPMPYFPEVAAGAAGVARARGAWAEAVDLEDGFWPPAAEVGSDPVAPVPYSEDNREQ